MATTEERVTALHEAMEALYEALEQSRVMPPVPFSSTGSEPEEHEPDATEEALARARRALDRAAS